MLELTPLSDIDPDQYFEDSSEMPDSRSQYLTVSEFKNLSTNSFSGLTIFNYNIRSFNANSNTFLSMFDSDEFPEAIILTETWFTCNYTADLDGYNSCHTTRPLEMRSGGVSVYVQNSLESDFLSELSYCNENIEICATKVKIDNQIVIILAIYRPNRGNVNEFLSELNNILNSRTLLNKRTILCGDLNIDLCSDSNESTSFVHFMQTFHFLPFISKPTRFAPNDVTNSSLLDHIWYNKVASCQSGIVLADYTDHCPTFIRIPLKMSKNSQSLVKISFRDESERNVTKFLTSVEGFDWNGVASENVNDYCESFLSTLDQIYNVSCPIKTKHIPLNRTLNPWVNQKLAKLIQAKSQYFNLCRLGIISKSENNIFKNRVKTIVTNARNNYYSRIFLRNSKDIKSTWNLINNLTGRNLNKSSINKIIWNSCEYSESPDIAHAFNSYFASIAQKLDSDLPLSTVDPLEYMGNDVSSTLFLSPVTPNEISNIIGNLRNTKQSIDKTPVKLLKLAKDILAAPISDLVNSSYIKATFPRILKCALVTPIYKKGDRSLPSNYRPISILPPLSKIFEQTIYSRLSNFLHINSVFTSSQFGFLKRKSTVDAIISLTENLYEILDRREFGISVFVDYMKAFDTINHKVLIRKLYKYGIRGTPLNLISDYLRDRQQRVRITNVLSSPTTLNTGVPQGSILGPILFLLYINDLPNVSPLCNYVLYADDTTLTFHHHDYPELVCICNRELEKINVWSKANRLSISFEKTSYMLFTTRNRNFDTSAITFGNNVIEPKSQVNFLGVILDNQLKFNYHTSHICNKISKSIGIIYKIRAIIPVHCIKILYYSLIQPYLQYVLPVWGGTYRYLIQPIVVLQKRAIRVICNVPFLEHTAPLFSNLNILTLDNLYKYNLLIFAYVNGNRYNTRQSHAYNTRFEQRLLPRFYRLDITQHSAIYQSIKVWNVLPNDIQTLPSLFSFKKCTRSYLMHPV